MLTFEPLPRAKIVGSNKMRTANNFLPLATPANIATLRASVETFRPRSAWSRGVAFYASMILDNFEEFARFNASEGLPAPAFNLETALNGAADWHHFAAGGCGLVYNASIAANLLAPSELRAWEAGRRSFDFIALEGRALSQAWQLLQGYFCQL